MARRPTVVVAVVVLLGVGVAIAVALLGGDDSGSGGTAVTPETVVSLPPTSPTTLGDEARALADLAAAGRAATFHATYVGHGSGSEYQVELFRSDGRTRQDVTRDEGAFHSVSIYDGDQAIVCMEQPDQSYVCSTDDADETVGDGVFAEVLASLEALPSGDVTITDETIDGRSGQCFAAEGLSICFDDDGVPLKVETPVGDLAITEVDDAVDDSTFEPPATPAETNS